MTINQTVRAMGNPRWPLGFSWIPEKKNSFLFDGIKPSLVSGSMSSQWKKKWLKMCFPPGVYFLQSPVIKHPPHWTNHTSLNQNFSNILKLSLSLSSSIIGQGQAEQRLITLN